MKAFTVSIFGLLLLAGCSKKTESEKSSSTGVFSVDECAVNSVNDCGGYTPLADPALAAALKTAWPNMCGYPTAFALPTAGESTEILSCVVRVCADGSCPAVPANPAGAEFEWLFGAGAMDDLIQARQDNDLIHPYSGMIGVSATVLFIKRPGGFTAYYRKSQINGLLQATSLDTAFDAFNRKNLHLYQGQFLGSKFSKKGDGSYVLKTGGACNVAVGAKQYVEFSASASGSLSFIILPDPSVPPNMFPCPIE